MRDDEVYLWVSHRRHVIETTELLPLVSTWVIHYWDVKLQHGVEELPRGLPIGPNASQAHRLYFGSEGSRQATSLALRTVRSKADQFAAVPSAKTAPALVRVVVGLVAPRRQAL